MINNKTLTWDDVYPIGSIYMSVNAVNPGTLFGGTWTQIKDTFLLACGDTFANGTGGGSITHTPAGTLSGGAVGDHTLTTAETPAHTHTRGTMNITGTWTTSWNKTVRGFHNLQTTGAFYPTVDTSKPGRITSEDNYANNSGSTGIPNFDASRNWTGETSSVGGGGAHNHPFTQPTFTGEEQNTMPPYLAVYIWKRTA